MNIAISGACGFVGSALSSFLKEKGHNVIPLGRKYFVDGSDILYNALSSCDIVINLAGATINKRWTEEYKREILNSRVETTRKIVNVIDYLSHKPKLFISTSAVGCYPENKISDEESPTADNTFLASVCKAWEQEAMKSKSQRTVICRFGIVLSPNGGALKQILRSYGFKTAVKFTSGDSSFPWISLEDLVDIIYFIINNEQINGIVNCVVAEDISYNKIVDKLNRYYHPFITIKIPSFIKNIMLGEMGSVITAGQTVLPKRLTEVNFTYKYPTIDSFLKEKGNPCR